jgi:dolichol kinase
VYLLIYALVPRWITLALFLAALVLLGMVEFIRLRRPELNAWSLQKFGGIHRPSEITGPSGIFWTLLGCWLTILIFTNKHIVIAALGFLAFGDAAAALVGKKWGRHFWKGSPSRTYEGSAAFFLVSALWALPFVRWPVALLGAAVGAWVEAQPFRWNDNLWIPVASGLALSLLNLFLGRH